MVHWLDHMLATILIVLYPLYSWNETRKVRRKVASTPDWTFDTVSEYKLTIGYLVALSTLCVVIWMSQTRDLGTLGLGLGATPLRLTAGAVLALVGIGMTHLQTLQMRKQENAREQLEAQFGDIAFFLPKTRQELDWFYLLSFAAGVCEEILYRGYLIWYFALWVGSVPALFASSIAFGVAHSYQGATNIPRTAFVGLWMGVMYLVSGSLWIPMLTHFIVDVMGGRMTYAILSQPART